MGFKTVSTSCDRYNFITNVQKEILLETDFIICVFKTKMPNANTNHNLVIIIILKTLNPCGLG